MNSTIAITGGAGFIGSHVAEYLVGLGARVVVFDNFSTGERSFLPKSDLCTVVEGDIRSRKDIGRMFDAYPAIDSVIHLAAQSKVGQSLADPAEDSAVNVMGTLNVTEAAGQHGVKRMVYASSAAVYGDGDSLPLTEDTLCRPLSPYGVSKLAGEFYVLNCGSRFGCRTGVFRFSNVFGPRQKAGTESGVITIFVDALLRGEQPVIYGDGEQTRDFVYVKDVAAALVAFLQNDEMVAGEDEQTPGVYHVSTNTETSINQLVHHLQGLTGSEVSPVYGQARSGDIRYSRLDHHKLRYALNWNADTSLYEGLKATVSYERMRNRKD